MTKFENTIPVSLLFELIELDAETGALFWKSREIHHFKDEGRNSPTLQMNSWNTRYAGKEAFCCLTNGSPYMRGTLLGQKVLKHRIVWAMFKGEWPTYTIDHIDGDKLNNIPSNLRDVTVSVNQHNQKNAHVNSKTGVLGVSKCHKGQFVAQFVAQLRAYGKIHRLGTFSSIELAEKAYKEGKLLYQKFLLTFRRIK